MMAPDAPALICHRTGKKQYPSPAAADRRRKVLKRRRNDRQSVYRCPHCRHWHLGHSNTIR